MDKYYIPSIEDIRVGYECYFIADLNNSVKESNLIPVTLSHLSLSSIFSGNGFLDTKRSPPNLISYVTSYLTKKQIKELNTLWFNFKDIDDEGAFEADLKAHGFTYRICWTSDNILQIWQNGLSYQDRIYLGICRCINDFKQIIGLCL